MRYHMISPIEKWVPALLSSVLSLDRKMECTRATEAAMASARQHFHIQWSSKDHLDWEAFNSIEEARIVAEGLARPGETYAISPAGDGCASCCTPKKVLEKVHPKPASQ